MSFPVEQRLLSVQIFLDYFDHFLLFFLILFRAGITPYWIHELEPTVLKLMPTYASLRNGGHRHKIAPTERLDITMKIARSIPFINHPIAGSVYMTMTICYQPFHGTELKGVDIIS